MSGNDKVEAEWRVDLGNILSINHIVIQLATNGDPWGMTFSKKTCSNIHLKSLNPIHFDMIVA